MYWRVRNCAQRTKDLVASLFIFRSFSATLWSRWITETDWFAIVPWLAKLSWSLPAWTLIFGTAFFQLIKGLVAHIQLVRSNDFPNCLHNLEKAPPQSASYFTQGKSVSQLFWYFLPLVVLWWRDLAFLSARRTKISLSCPSLVLDSLVVSAVEGTDVLETIKKDLMFIIRRICETGQSLGSLYTFTAELLLVQKMTS